MSVKMECPSCHTDYHNPDNSPDNTPDLPDHGAVAVCLNCAIVTVWDHERSEWLPAVGQHLRELLAMPNILECVMRVREFNEQQERDRETLRSLISHGFVMGLSITEVVEEILADGFHRHPDTDDGEDN